MIKHLIKLLWNKKKQNSMMVIEIFLSFIVLFAVFSIAIHNLINFNRSIGFNSDNMWRLSIDWNTKGEPDIGDRVDRLKTAVRDFNEVEHTSVIKWRVMFLGGSTNSSNGVYYNDINYNPHPYVGDDDFAEVMQLKFSEGRWFNKSDDAATIVPIVINKKFSQDMFGDESAIGKVIQLSQTDPQHARQIIGVVETYKGHGEFSKPEHVMFKRTVLRGSMNNASMLIKVNEASGAELEKRILDRISTMEKTWTFNIKTTEEIKTTYYVQTLIPIFVLSIVGGFLIINVVLGLFGALWYTINQRKAEIGLRRAKGALAKNIYRQFILEVFILAGFGSTLASFITIQFPILDIFPDVDSIVYILSILSSLIIIYILVFVCALYPSKQAMEIQPAMALHEE